MFVPRNLSDSTADTVLLRMVKGECRSVLPEVHRHLHCFERGQLKVVDTAPDSQLLYFLSLARLITVLDETNNSGVICKFQDLHRGV